MTIQPPNTDDSSPRIIPLDVEHGGIRLALPLLTLSGLAIGYVLTSLIVNALNLDIAVGCASFVGAVACALLLATAADYFLKRLWPSGLSLSVGAEGLQLNDMRRKSRDASGQPRQTRLRWNERINWLTWQFKIKRGSARVPKGWVMLGVQLLQDEAEVTLYTFMPEKQARELPDYSRFSLLLPRVQIESDKLPLREKSQQRRLARAETARWESGAEVRREDFPALLDIIVRHVSDEDASSGGPT